MLKCQFYSIVCLVFIINLLKCRAKILFFRNGKFFLKYLVSPTEAIGNVGNVACYFRILHASQSISPSIRFSTSSGSIGKKSMPVIRSTASTVRQ